MHRTGPRVVLLTADGAYSRRFLRRFLDQARVEVVGLVLSTATLNRGVFGLAGMWRFLRSVGLCYAIYQAFVCLVLPRLKGLKRCLDVPVLHTSDVNAPEAEAWVRATKPDYLLSFHFNQKLLEPVIQIPKQAALNFHPSYLPSFRGVDPVLFALQETGSTLGGSVHQMTSMIDGGDILLREFLGKEQVGGLIATNAHLFTLGGGMAAEVINHFAEYDLRRLAQDQLGKTQTRYDGWTDVGRLGCLGLLKALWGRRR